MCIVKRISYITREGRAADQRVAGNVFFRYTSLALVSTPQDFQSISNYEEQLFHAAAYCTNEHEEFWRRLETSEITGSYLEEIIQVLQTFAHLIF